MKFTVHKKHGELHFIAGKIVSFKDGEYETGDKREIEFLEQSKYFNRVATKQTKSPA